MIRRRGPLNLFALASRLVSLVVKQRSGKNTPFKMLSASARRLLLSEEDLRGCFWKRLVLPRRMALNALKTLKSFSEMIYAV